MSELQFLKAQRPHAFSARIGQTTPSSRIRTLVADSHDITLAGTCAVLSRTPHITVVATATTATDALAAAVSHTIDLALLELQFSDGQDSDIFHRFQSSCPDTRVIILAENIDEESVFSALHAGAAAILDKRITEASLVHAVDAVCCGHMVFNRRVLQPLIGHLEELSRRSPKNTRAQFSSQERKIMALVAEGQTNREIARTLGLTNKTVKNRLSTLYGKLHVTRRTQAAKMFLEQAHKNSTINLQEIG